MKNILIPLCSCVDYAVFNLKQVFSAEITIKLV